MPLGESQRCICFDCDSTLSSIEGIDELAERKGGAEKIAPLTTAAMEGRIGLEEVYARRLEILQPSREDIDWLGRRYVATLVEGASEAIHQIQEAGSVVCIVSGGLRQSVLQLAETLGVAPSCVFAVEAYFDASGLYSGFDAASPLTRSEGKATVCAALAAEYGPVVLIGDGVTDIAAKASGAYVIGFGGVVRREAVVRGADAFIDGPSLRDVADFVLRQISEPD